jgi:phosphatidylglycerophosphate synthase
MNGRRQTLAVIGPLILGLILLAVALARTDVRAIADAMRRVGVVLPLALLPSAAWHLLRTAAWYRCFPADARPSFPRAFRLRLAAEAFSFVTISGLAGDPLKVVLLQREVAPAISAAAVALERILYLGATMVIVGIAAATALFSLPLSTTWRYVYVAVALFPPLFIGGAALLVVRWRGRQSPASQSDSRQRGRVQSFIRDLLANLRQTARRDPGRIASVALIEAAAYGTMALEVWLALRLTGTPVSWIAAFAVETFTRVVSMAAAFIPGGLGALEASNMAGAAAIHAAAGGVALALVRRVRGLVWCAAGFLVYPTRPWQIAHPQLSATEETEDTEGRTRKTSVSSVSSVVESSVMENSVVESSIEGPCAVVFDVDLEVMPSERLGGLPIGERIARATARAGYSTLLVWSPRRSDLWGRVTARLASRIVVHAECDPVEWRRRLASFAPDSPVTVMAPGIVPSLAVLEAARARDEESAGVERLLPRQIESPESLAAPLRRRVADPPRSFSVTNRDELDAAERSLRASIFKPTDGKLASLNRRLSIPISVMLIRLMRMNANLMSVLIIALGFWSGWLFSRGDYLHGVLAALISWAASVLDGCDGELARLQYTESAFGCWVDTIGDYIYYLAIFAGLTAGTARATGWGGFWWIGAALAVGMFLTFALLILLRGRITAGHPERLHANAKQHFYSSGSRWKWLVAKLSTCTTRATMPYGIVALAVADLLPVVLVVAAFSAHVYWMCLALELRDLLAIHRQQPVAL